MGKGEIRGCLSCAEQPLGDDGLYRRRIGVFLKREISHDTVTPLRKILLRGDLHRRSGL